MRSYHGNEVLSFVHQLEGYEIGMHFWQYGTN